MGSHLNTSAVHFWLESEIRLKSFDNQLSDQQRSRGELAYHSPPFPGISLARRGRGASIADLNRDGLLDLMVVNRTEPISVFQHLGYPSEYGPRIGGNWLAVELQQKGGNRHAVGARITIKTGNKVESRDLNISGRHASGGSSFIHFGLGVAEHATIRVQWSDDEWSATYRVLANQHVVIKEGQGKYWSPLR